jgi:hypothetical protein
MSNRPWPCYFRHNDGTQAREFDGDQFTRNSPFNQNHGSSDFLHHCLDLFHRAEFIVVYILFLMNISAEDSLDLRVETSFMQNFEPGLASIPEVSILLSILSVLVSVSVSAESIDTLLHTSY